MADTQAETVEQIEADVIELRKIYYAAREGVKQSRVAVAKVIKEWVLVSGVPTQSQLHHEHAQSQLRHRAAVIAGTETEYREPSRVGDSILDRTLAGGRSAAGTARWNSARRGSHGPENKGRRIQPKLPSER